MVRARLARLLVISMGAASLVAAGPARAADGRFVPAPAAVTGSGIRAQVGDRELMITADLGNGTTGLWLYSAPPEVGGAGLLSMLKARGTVPAAVESTAAVESAPQGDPRSCPTSYGEAQYLGNASCQPLRWSWGGFSDPQVYFRDHTPSRWPVRDSVTKWNEAVGVDSYHTLSTCPGGGRHCVHVWNANYGPTWYGHTYMQFNSSNFFVEGTVVVHLNDYYSPTLNREVTCHELGHALGLAHNGHWSSCLFNDPGPKPARIPNSPDFSVLRNILYP
jgi:hypothetical protein